MRRSFFALALLLPAAWFCGGCATPSLHIPSSPPPAWTFEPPAPTYIRLPVTLSVPKLGTVASALNGLVPKKDGMKGAIEEFPKAPIKTLLSLLPIPRLEKLWEAAQEPIYIEEGIWLMLRPEWFSTGIAVPSINLFKTHPVLEMKTYPTLVFGPKPELKKKKFPPIHWYKSGPSGFQALGDTFISFEEANRILADPKNKLVGRVVPGSGSYKLRIKSVRLYGSAGKVIAQTMVEYNRPLNIDDKPVQMTIYFRGRPWYDPKRKQFYLSHLDFDVKTNDFLTQVASWMFKSDLIKDIKRHARIPIGPKLEQIKDRMNVVLNRDILTMSRLETRVDSFDFVRAYVGEKGIIAQLSVKGEATLRLLGR
jgi:hypothetical protein